MNKKIKSIFFLLFISLVIISMNSCRRQAKPVTADDFYNIGDYKNALAEYEHFVKKNPKNIRARYGIFRAHIKMKQYEEALKSEKVLRNTVMRVTFREYEKYDRRIQDEKRIEHLKRKKAGESFYNKAIIQKTEYQKKKLLKKALKEYLEALVICPDYSKKKEIYRQHWHLKAENLNDLGVIYGELKIKDKEFEYLKKATEEYPGMIMAYLNLGAHFEERNQFRKAIDYYSQVLIYDPDNLLAFYNIGFLYDTLGKVKSAREYYRSYLDKYIEVSNKILDERDQHRSTGDRMFNRKKGEFKDVLSEDEKSRKLDVEKWLRDIER